MRIDDIIEAYTPLKDIDGVEYFAEGRNIYAVDHSVDQIDYSREDVWFQRKAKLPNVIGVLSLHGMPQMPYLLINAVHVHSSYRRQGVMKNLYNAGVKYARKMGKKGIASEPMMRNEKSDKFWEKYGREQADVNILDREIR